MGFGLLMFILYCPMLQCRDVGVRAYCITNREVVSEGCRCVREEIRSTMAVEARPTQAGEHILGGIISRNADTRPVFLIVPPCDLCNTAGDRLGYGSQYRYKTCTGRDEEERSRQGDALEALARLAHDRRSNAV
ncbi:hypothetical protein LY76DRAFT_23809 [Colletotrichum caudatum]|nr:hypothetical protein LY76DRAFT_23809 [Colletotrichum caudatum]